jgi:uncharacterized protein (DUF427 family)
MSLTTGRAPLSADPAGRFDPPVPTGAIYVEPFLRRVRAALGERTVIDSERVLLVHRSGQPPTYAFPAVDVRGLPVSVEPAALGYVRVPWGAATAWFEEEEEVFGGHPRNPYHRVDCVRARRRLRVEVATEVLVDTQDVISLYETSRAPQLYVRREAVRMDLLVASSTVSYCPYKGRASYWTADIHGTVVRDVAWSYNEPLPESVAIAGMLSFYPERTSMIQDILTWFTAPPAAPRGPDHGRSHD